MSEGEEVVVVSASHAGNKGGVKEATFYNWKYRQYFKVVEEGDKNLRARCTLCSDSAKPLSCARNTTSNFKKHLDSVHKTTSLIAILPQTTKRKRSEDDEGNQAKRQATLERRAISSEEIRKVVMEYVIEDMLPLTTVESSAFRKLIDKLSPRPVQLPDRKTISLCIEQAYDTMMKKIKETLGKVESVSTTADVWTSQRRSYLGMTVHWIDDKSLKRQKAAIACIRITGRHTYDILAAKIEEIHRSFGLHGKISATVTDNGSNFVKAFTSFSVQETEHDNDDEISMVDDDGVVPDDDVEFTDLHSLMIPDQDDDDLTQVEYELPPHQRCASHTLNLVASADVEKHLLSSSLSKSLYRNSFGKCTTLWNKTRRSTLAADKMTEKLKRKLLVPSPTRWNSYFDAVSRVIENPSSVLNEFCNDIGVRSFSEKELAFLKEYCVVLEPLSKGLDILQGEDRCYYGTLLPTLHTIIKKTKAEIPNLSVATTGFAYAIESSIKRRFENVFDSKEAIIAALVSPKFKTKWVDSQESKDGYIQMMIDELRALDSVTVTGDELSTSQNDEKKRDFYEFDTDDDEPTEDNAESEAAEYFRSAKSLDCLGKYPKVKQLFLRYNVTIPSSAPVERLFSLGSLVLSSRRNRLTDGKFEKILLMRYNKHFL